MPPRARPLLIYDGDCNFCRRWISRWRHFTKERVAYAPSQEVAEEFPEISSERFQASVQLVEPSGRIFEGAEAVFRTLAYAPRRRWLLWAYEKIPGVRLLTEWFYRLVARRRIFFSKLTHFLWGTHVEPSTYFFSSELFLRLLGAIYLIAFFSLWNQVEGLIGSHGILPAEVFLRAVEQQTGPERYGLVPTWCWLKGGDLFLNFLCGAGVFFSLLLTLGFAPIPLLLLLWSFYLSLVSVGQDFFEFQWDNLLLEAGFLAIFLAPFRLGPPSFFKPPPSRTILFLFKWLLFRLVFSSGAVKLASADPAWANLTALNFHYETQPLPTWIGWYAHQLPEGFQKFSVFVTFTSELGAPFLIFMPRRLLLFGGALLALFQLLILLTGNYCFFNLLTLALCLLLLDDFFWPRFLREKVKEINPSPFSAPPRFSWPKWVVGPLAGAILAVTTFQMFHLFRVRFPWPAPFWALYQGMAPFRTVNSYGLFAVMTTSRPEIIVEGSDDGERWLSYEFKWKPGDLKRRPGFVAPHQPRLDWQMWFAALGGFRNHPWFLNFLARVSEGSPEVLKLLEKNPFPDGPPRYLRALLYDYRFTDLATRRATGAWWHRKLRGLYCPILSQEDFSQAS